MRARRSELLYAISLLDELRQHIMHDDEWLNGRTLETAVVAKFDRRGKSRRSGRSQGVLLPMRCLRHLGGAAPAVRDISHAAY